MKDAGSERELSDARSGLLQESRNLNQETREAMTAAVWFNMLFVFLVVFGFTLPFAIYFMDVFNGRRTLPTEITALIKRASSQERSVH
jgi:hypothetical protein